MLNFPVLKRKVLNKGALFISLFKLRPLLADIKRGSIIIDCGANIGDITAQFTKTGAKVYSFEPDPLAFGHLQKRFEDKENISLFQQAVWIEDTQIPFYFHKDRKAEEMELTVSSSIVDNKNNINDAQKIMIEAIDLVAFIESLDAPVALLKIDIEGAEIELLHKIIASEIYKKINLAVVETHESKIPGHIEKVAKIKQLLKEKNIDNIKLNWI